MAVFKIVCHPDPVLREKAERVKKITPHIEKLIDNMADTMYSYNGVGLAAPQIGVSKRVIVVDVGEGLVALVNPEIVETEGSERGKEGCLSIPGYWGEVDRAQRVRVKGLSRNGKEVVISAEGFLARALQHEIDHLDGILFIDRAVHIYEDKG
ncbi:MAG: peptide deformylase [Peptococcaceae bacterium]|nr:peptide deformylase [Peptococcaceae bacterium]